jgi:hypothetical protein
MMVSTRLYTCWKISPIRSGTAKPRIKRSGEPTVISFVFLFAIIISSENSFYIYLFSLSIIAQSFKPSSSFQGFLTVIFTLNGKCGKVVINVHNFNRIRRAP